MYCFDLSQKKQCCRKNKDQQLTVKQLTENGQKMIDGPKKLGSCKFDFTFLLLRKLVGFLYKLEIMH